MNKDMYFQTKSIPVNVKDIDMSGRIVKGYFASFETLDSDGDIFRKGAFKKTIEENKHRIKHLFNHWDAVGVLQELKEDGTGVYFVSQMGRHTLGNDVLLMYEDGIVTEHSVGFQTIKQHKEDKSNVITEVKMWEGSSLDKWGANMNTPVVKSAEKVAEMMKRLQTLEKALRDGKYTDDTFIELEIQLKQIQQFLHDTTPEPEISTLEPEAKDLNINKLISLFTKNS
jgi:HK97 family phage prohead protease